MLSGAGCSLGGFAGRQAGVLSEKRSERGHLAWQDPEVNPFSVKKSKKYNAPRTLTHPALKSSAILGVDQEEERELQDTRQQSAQQSGLTRGKKAEKTLCSCYFYQALSNFARTGRFKC